MSNRSNSWWDRLSFTGSLYLLAAAAFVLGAVVASGQIAPGLFVAGFFALLAAACRSMLDLD